MKETGQVGNPRSYPVQKFQIPGLVPVIYESTSKFKIKVNLNIKNILATYRDVLQLTERWRDHPANVRAVFISPHPPLLASSYNMTCTCYYS